MKGPPFLRFRLATHGGALYNGRTRCHARPGRGTRPTGPFQGRDPVNHLAALPHRE